MAEEDNKTALRSGGWGLNEGGGGSGRALKAHEEGRRKKENGNGLWRYKKALFWRYIAF